MWYFRLILICRSQWWCSPFKFMTKNSLLGKFGLRIQNCFNFNFDFFCFRSEITFLGKLIPKNQNYQFKLKFGTKSNSNMKNSLAMLTFSVFNRKYYLCNFFLKFKTNCLRWNLVKETYYNMQNSMMVLTFSGLY